MGYGQLRLRIDKGWNICGRRGRRMVLRFISFLVSLRVACFKELLGSRAISIRRLFLSGGKIIRLSSKAIFKLSGFILRMSIISIYKAYLIWMDNK